MSTTWDSGYGQTGRKRRRKGGGKAIIVRTPQSYCVIIRKAAPGSTRSVRENLPVPEQNYRLPVWQSVWLMSKDSGGRMDFHEG